MDGKSDGWNLGLDYGNFGLLKENFMETKERIKVNAEIQEYTDWLEKSSDFIQLFLHILSIVFSSLE